jgi:2-polyprenyl-3-methyl-5-hydroxy-6-metoxy-1,4-benzoquinol methylase
LIELLAKLSDQILQENEGIKVVRKQTCILCGSQGDELYQGLHDRIASAPGTWGYKRCPKDGLIWLDPQPIPEDLDKLYEGYDLTHTINPPPTLRFAKLRKYIREGILATAFGYHDLAMNGWQKILGRFFSQISPLRDAAGGMILWVNGSTRGRLLDVGCGNGEIADNLQNLGWTVTGVEPDQTAAKLAGKRYKLEVFIGSIEEAKFPAESFDAITMAHVIEHLHTPKSALNECYRLLKPSGKLIIITPNIRGLGHRLFKDSWLYLDPPRHLNIYSHELLKTEIKWAGFTCINIRSPARNSYSVWIGSQDIRQNGKFSDGKLSRNKSLSVNLTGLGFMVIEYFLSSILYSGEELVFTATK